MSNSSVIRSRYDRNEIISVMQQVATLMGSRKQKAHYITETSKISLQTTFLEEKSVAISEKLKKLNAVTRQAEVTAKEPSDTMLRLQSAKKTLTNEYNRFNEIAKKSRQRVNGKNQEAIDLLSRGIETLENESIPFTDKLLVIAQQNNVAIQERKDHDFFTMAKLHTDFVAGLNFTTNEMDQSSKELEGLNLKAKNINEHLGDLATQEDKLTNEIPVLDGVITEKQEDKKALENELEKLLNTKKRIDSLEDPKAYIDELSLQLEEDKLSLEAKQDALEAVQRINNELKEINGSLEEGIEGYVSIITKFEETLAQL